ncbi:MAG: hypothetical protein JJE02_00850 [Propionibacteriales bacterium]|nr:hypothetical protein [Propionibacteriales bacterium]
MNTTPPARDDDPWVAFGRIGGGVLVYGIAGFLLDRWLGTTFIVGIGIVVGAALGIYTVMSSQRIQ